MLVQSVRWLAFCVSNSITRTVVHFFPSCGVVTAPYAANCNLTIFGQGLERKTTTLEGARMSHPDGVRLEQVFAELVDGAAGFIGLEIEIFTLQPRVDISPSSCLVEFYSRVSSVRYFPRRVSESGGALPGLFLRDQLNATSFVVVNNSAEGSVVELCSHSGSALQRDVVVSGGQDGVVLEEPIKPGDLKVIRRAEVAAGAVSEIAIEREGVAKGGQPSMAEGIYLGSIVPELACFGIYRDLSQKKLISVCAL